MRHLFMHFADYFQSHSGHDDLVVMGKWIGAMVFLSVPSFVPDLEQWIKLVASVGTLITACLGAIIMAFRLADYLEKRLRERKQREEK